jgi:hypothetical protein
MGNLHPGKKHHRGGDSVSGDQWSRQEVVRILRRAGYRKLADEAMRDLPDPVDVEYVFAWGAEHGVTRDRLISRMGGSP